MKLKKLLSISLLCSLMISPVAHADSLSSKSLMKKFTCWADEQDYGFQTVNPDIQDSLTVNGIAKLKDATVTNQVVVNGVLIGLNINFGSLVVNGAVSLVDSTVLRGIEVNGLLSAKNCLLNGTLSLSSDIVFLVGCTVDSIYVHATGNKKQVIILGKGTTVNGTIQFETGKGIIIQKGDVSMKGPIIGAQTILKK